jgi:hypothetical protein
MDGETFLGIADRIGEQRVEAARAEELREHLPGLDRARDGDRMRTVGRHRRVALLPVPAGLRSGRRAAGAVQPMHRAVRFGHDREAVAADAGHVRLDNGEDGAGGDRRIHRVAAVAQHRQRRGGRERVRRRRHAVLGDHRRAAGQVEWAHEGLGRSVRCALS